MMLKAIRVIQLNNLIDFKRKKIKPARGIEPRSPAQQAVPITTTPIIFLNNEKHKRYYNSKNLKYRNKNYKINKKDKKNMKNLIKKI